MWPSGDDGPGNTGIADQDVELAMALVQRCAEACDAVEVGEVERHQCGAAAIVADIVVEFFEACLRSRHGYDMRAGLCQRARGGVADAARRAGDESDAGGEGKGRQAIHSMVVPAKAGTHTP